MCVTRPHGGTDGAAVPAAVAGIEAMKPIIFIAAPWESHDGEAMLVGERLEALGYEVVSRWHKRGFVEDESHIVNAENDLMDVYRSNTVVRLSYIESGRPGGGGGRFIEFGAGLATAKAMWVVGPVQTIYDYLAHVVRDVDELIIRLAEVE